MVVMVVKMQVVEVVTMMKMNNGMIMVMKSQEW